MNKLMLLDCNGLCHALKHATKNLSYRGQRTGILFGFIKMLLKLQEAIKADEWVFAWDSSKGYLRQKECPQYKANRKADKTEEEKKLDEISYPQFNTLRGQLLEDLGFGNILCFDGFESDDIMAAASFEKAEIWIVTRDKDLYQCLKENVSIYDPIGEKPYRLSDLAGQWSCSPDEWVQAMAIAGCDTDNVKGVSGVGMKTAIKFVQGRLAPESKACASIYSSVDMGERNFNLVSLPHPALPKFKIKQSKIRPTAGRMLAVAYKYGMGSLTSVQFKSRWEEAFK